MNTVEALKHAATCADDAWMTSGVLLVFEVAPAAIKVHGTKYGTRKTVNVLWNDLSVSDQPEALLNKAVDDVTEQLDEAHQELDYNDNGQPLRSPYYHPCFDGLPVRDRRYG